MLKSISLHFVCSYFCCFLSRCLLFLFAINVGVVDITAEVGLEKKLLGKNHHLIKDEWELVELSGMPAGYGRIREYTFDRNGQTLRQIDSVMRMQMKRLGQKVETAISIQATFNPQGRMLEFRSETDLGGQVLVSTGRVDGGNLEVSSGRVGQIAKAIIPWSDNDHGLFYEQRMLEKQPMVPGEQREFSVLLPIFNRVAKTKLNAGNWSQVQLIGDTKELLPIQSETTLLGQQFTATLWMDRDGRILRTKEPTLGQTVTRTTKQKALAGKTAAAPDLIAETVIPLKSQSPKLEDAKSARYHVVTVETALKPPFPDSSHQVCTPGNGQATWSLLVSVGDPSRRPLKDAAEDLPKSADRKPNRYVDQSDTAVRQLAETAGVAQTEAALAKALSKKVYLWITQKDFSTVLATATEVARTRRGDCTEHAVLLAAIAKARGLPARVVVGLVYVPSLGGFAYHMWNQIWCDGKWCYFDATRWDGRCGVGHIKVADAALDDQSGLTVFLPVLQVMRGMQIELSGINE